MEIKSLEEWLVIRRLQANELAEKAEVDRATISRLINGRQSTRMKTARKIAEILDVELEQISEFGTLLHFEETGPSWTEDEIAEAHLRIKADADEPTIPHEMAKAEINQFFEELRRKYSNTPDKASA